MIKRPVFKSHLRIVVVQDEGVLLLSEVGHKILTGKAFQLMAPLIDGTRSADDIVDCLSDALSAPEVYFALLLLEKNGYVIEAEPRMPLDAFWAARGIDPRTARSRLQETPVEIASLAGLDAAPLVSALKSFGIALAEAEGLQLVLADDYLRVDLEAYNERALRSGRPWMIVKPTGTEIFIGPLFVPGSSGCWSCLRTRHLLNRETDQFIMTKYGEKEPIPLPAAHTAATVQVALNLAATEIALWIAARENPKIEGGLLAVDTLTWQSTRHALARIVHCSSCGTRPKLTVGTPVILQERKIAFDSDGGYRIVSPDETLRKFEHLVSPVTGIVKALERDDSLDGTAHVYVAGQNFSLRNESLAFLKDGLRSMSSGKGMSDSQAKASALCEAIERHSGLFHGYEPRITSSRSRLGAQAVHPNTCMLFSQRQYANRDAINSRKGKFNFVPPPFDDDSLEIEWSPVWSLTNQTFKFLPTEYLYYRYAQPAGRVSPVCFRACSNGNASGNCLEEAVLQGFLELVERDCVALWWYNMLKRPAIDIGSFEEPYFERLIDSYKRNNRDVWALDITSDLGIPAVAAISRMRDAPQERIIFGFGCHLDPKLAVQRALTEMNQSLPHVRRAFADNDRVSVEFGDHEAVEWWKTASCATHPYLTPHGELVAQWSTDRQIPYSDNILANIQLCQKLVERRGMEMLVLDQTRPDIGVSVVKVIVPGLRHFWARFAPGRLYDVPVQMNWLQTRTKEEELNPIPMFL